MIAIIVKTEIYTKRKIQRKEKYREKKNALAVS